jgi:hypothetical protein
MPYTSWALHATGPERVLDVDLAASEILDVLFEIRRGIRLQTLESPDEPPFQTSADGGELPLDGDLGEVVDGNPAGFRGLLQVAERLVVVEMQGESSAAHDLSLHLQGGIQRVPREGTDRLHRNFQPERRNRTSCASKPRKPT